MKGIPLLAPPACWLNEIWAAVPGNRSKAALVKIGLMPSLELEILKSSPALSAEKLSV